MYQCVLCFFSSEGGYIYIYTHTDTDIKLIHFLFFPRTWIFHSFIGINEIEFLSLS